MTPKSCISSRWCSSVLPVRLGFSDALQPELVILTIITVFCKGSLCVYCFLYRRYPAVHVFFIDHRNDIAVNIFGLVMSIVGTRVVWYVDPIGAILIGVLILVSWGSNAFDNVWLLVGKSAPKEYISKLIYMIVTHDDRIKKVDTVSVPCLVLSGSDPTFFPSPTSTNQLLNSVELTMPDNGIMSRLILLWTRMRPCGSPTMLARHFNGN